MRLAPVPLFYHPDRRQVLHHSAESARTTHGAAECLDTSRLFGDMLARALSGAPKPDVLFGRNSDAIASPAIRVIARGAYREKSDDDIRGSGYVVACLEAAL